ncbi:MAG: reductase [Herminiimonas sp.]|nr:reductase [Herminiimonas sp.]
MKLQILALSGSQRTKSWSTALLRAMQQLAPAWVDFTIFEEHKVWPLFNPELEDDVPESIARFRAAIASAGAIVIASPEYAHGVTGTIKNTLDWLVSYPPFADKPVAVLNPSLQSFHADLALKETLRTMSADLIADACVRIPVIGSGIAQDAIATDPRFIPAIDAVLRAITLYVEQASREA